LATAVVTIVDDLFFLAKIQQTARQLGVTTHAANAASAVREVAEAQPRAVILDLNHRAISALEVVRSLKADPATRSIPIIGFVSHVQADLVQAARAAACDQVMARSAFTQQLPALLRKLAGGDGGESPRS
jgi:CheY-like chemotaxis protein